MKTSFSLFCRGILLASVCLLLCGCFIKPYQFDLYQGNELCPDKVAEVEMGMTREQVRYLLGTPLLNDVFDTDRWDYVYLCKPGKGDETRRHLAIFFEHGRVCNITHDPLTVVDVA